jgi:hypothetical protein
MSKQIVLIIIGTTKEIDVTSNINESFSDFELNQCMKQKHFISLKDETIKGTRSMNKNPLFYQTTHLFFNRKYAMHTKWMYAQVCLFTGDGVGFKRIGSFIGMLCLTLKNDTTDIKRIEK